ncbi:MAG: FmdB family zinc ribbon protein [Thermoleophilia bacterium]
MPDLRRHYHNSTIANMPIYEYCCGSCKARFEELVRSMEASADVRCPACGSLKTDRLMSGFSFSSGGSGGSAAGKSCGTCSSTSCASCG